MAGAVLFLTTVTFSLPVAAQTTTPLGTFTNLTADLEGIPWGASMSADGSTAFFNEWHGESSDGFIVDLETALRTSTTGSDLDLTADGQTATYSTSEGSAFRRVVLFNRKAGEVEPITNDATLDFDAPSISDDGLSIVFQSTVPTLDTSLPILSAPERHVYLWQKFTGSLRDLRPSAVWSQDPIVSGDGSSVVFSSIPDDLASLKSTALFVWAEDQPEAINISGDLPNVKSPSISDDGNLVSFESSSSPGGLPEGSSVHLWSRASGDVTTLTSDRDRWPQLPRMSGDGSTIAFTSLVRVSAGAFSGKRDVFLLDLASGGLTNITDETISVPAVSAISRDGRKILIRSEASTLNSTVWRSPDLYMWVAGPRVSDATTIDEIVDAADYDRGAHAKILRLYRAIFNREPDVSGAKYWIDVHRQGYGVIQIAGFMAASQEWANAYSGTTNEQFVEIVYSNVLGRSYDQSGYEYWLSLVATGQLSRHGMVYYVTANTEFTARYPYGPVPVGELYLVGRANDGFTMDSSFEEIAGAVVCTVVGSADTRTVAALADQRQIPITIQELEDGAQVIDAFLAGTCDIVTTDGSTGVLDQVPVGEVWVRFPRSPFIVWSE